MGKDPAQNGRQVASIVDNMEVLPGNSKFVQLSGRQAPSDYDGARMTVLRLADETSTLRRGGVGDAAGVDDENVRECGDIDVGQAMFLKEPANLLALVLVHFAAAC